MAQSTGGFAIPLKCGYCDARHRIGFNPDQLPRPLAFVLEFALHFSMAFIWILAIIFFSWLERNLGLWGALTTVFVMALTIPLLLPHSLDETDPVNQIIERIQTKKNPSSD